LLVINYLPWIFIKFDTEYGILQETFFIDFKNSEGYYHEKIDYIFESSCTNCSKNSNNFIGITKNDFTDVPKIATYAFISLAILGIIFTIFEIIERKYNLSNKIALLVHSTFAIAAFFISIFVIFILIKFLGIYFLLFYNRPFIEASGIRNLILISPTTINLILISLIVIIITIGIIQINFREFEKKVFLEKSHTSLSTFKFGFKI
jgi:hypothetical protein